MKGVIEITLCMSAWLFFGSCYNASMAASRAQDDFPAQQSIYLLSPHPDDAVLTFGGLIGRPVFSPETGTKDVYYSVYSNVSTYTADGSASGKPQVTGLRLLEDVSALDSLLKSSAGVRKYHYSAANNEDANLIEMPDADFSDFNSDAEMAFNSTYFQVLTLMKAASSSSASCAFFVNSALPNPGGKAHFNHFVLREASLKALHDIGVDMKCEFYLGEDLPYYINNESGSAAMIEQLTGRLGLEALTYAMDVDKKMNAVNKYPSQLTPDYGRSVLTRADQLSGAERVYQVPVKNYSTFHTDISCGGKLFCNY